MSTRGLAAALLLLVAAARAQTELRIGYVVPAGAAPGTSTELVVGGRGLQNVHAIHLTGAGWSAAVLEYQRPLTQQERNAAREEVQRLTQLARSKKLEPADQQKLAELRQKLAASPRQQPNPQIAETVRLRLQLDADATPGVRDLRLRTPGGLSNPLRLVVSALREWRESEPNELSAGAPVDAELPLVINGQILPGDVDRFRIRARGGTDLVVAVAARALLPYLADAVPGWFQATLALRDGRGRELLFVDDYRQGPDPVLHWPVPADGDYVLEIRDALYRGREDFVYRMSVGALPLVTGVFPLGAQVGTPTTVQLAGVNLPPEQRTLRTVATEPGVRALDLGPLRSVGGAVPFAVDTLPECLEHEPDDDPSAAQRLSLPIVVNGRIGTAGDRDVFRFRGGKGQALVAEVLARRLDAPLDSVLLLTDEGGRELARNDDHEDARAGLVTHHADSWLSVRLPADGVYFLHLRDAQDHGGEDYAYRLRVGPPRPDFALRVVPSAINLRSGATAVVTVHALRQDGFAGDIALSLDGAPPGLTLAGGCVPGNQSVVRITLTAPPEPLEQPVPLRLVGQALVGSTQTRRAAVPADDLMQAFAYHHLVPADELLLSVGRGGRVPRLLRRDETPVRIPLGGTAAVLFPLPRRPAAAVEGLRFALKDPPAGVTLAGTTRTEAGLVLNLRAEPKAAAGLRGNLIVEVFQERPATASQPARPRQTTPVALLPALPFVLVRE